MSRSLDLLLLTPLNALSLAGIVIFWISLVCGVIYVVFLVHRPPASVTLCAPLLDGVIQMEDDEDENLSTFQRNWQTDSMQFKAVPNRSRRTR